MRNAFKVLLIGVLASGAVPLDGAPVISNITAVQNPSTKLVEIAYDLATPALCQIALAVSTNNGLSYDLTAATCSGSGYGTNVAAGSHLTIYWNAGRDWTNHYSTQIWFKLTASEHRTNALAFTEITNIYVDTAEHGSIWGQPVYDGSNLVVSCEFGTSIAARVYTLDLTPLSDFITVADTNDTAGERIADHKHLFQNGYHYLLFSISGTNSDGGSLWLVKFDRNFTRTKIVQVITNEPPTNDPLLFSDGYAFYAGKFFPSTNATYKIYKYDTNLCLLATYLEGVGENRHANLDVAAYLDGNFCFTSPQFLVNNHVYYRILYDTNFNAVASKAIILQDTTNNLGMITGLSYYNGRFISHYAGGTNEDFSFIGRAVYDAITWQLIQNDVAIAATNHAPQTIIVSNTLFLGYSEAGVPIRSRIAKYQINEPPETGAHTNTSEVGPVIIDTRAEFGPRITANDICESLTIAAEEPLTVKVALFPGQYAGISVDWWVIAYDRAGSWYYLSNTMHWMPFNGNLAFCRPAHQGGLFYLTPTTVLRDFILAPGIYDFWFAVDYPMDGILNLDGPMLYDHVTVFAQ